MRLSSGVYCQSWELIILFYFILSVIKIEPVTNQMISLRDSYKQTFISVTPSNPLNDLEWIFRSYEHYVITNHWRTFYYCYEQFFCLLILQFYFLSILLDYWFPIVSISNKIKPILKEWHHNIRLSSNQELELASTIVTLCRWSAKQTIPLSALARNQTKAWARDLVVTGSRKGTPVGVGQRNSESGLAKGDASGQSTPDSRSDQYQWEKTDQDGLAFLVAL